LMFRRFLWNKYLRPGVVIFITSVIAAVFSCERSFAQTQEEMDLVTHRFGRPQTKSSTCSFLAGQFEATGQFEKAIEYYSKMLKVYADDPALGPTSPKYAWALTKIALCEKKAGHSSKAAALCKKARDIVSGRTPDNDRFNTDYLNGIEKNCLSILGTAPSSEHSSSPYIELQGIAKMKFLT